MRASLLRHVHSVASKHNPETPTRAVCLVLDHREDYPSEWTAITAVSKRLGMTAQTLRIWSRQQQVDHGEREGDPFGGPVVMRLSVDGSWPTVGQTRPG